MKDGIYINLDATEYRKDQSLSCSGIKEFERSPLEYWTNSYMNPNRPVQEQTPAMRLGTMRHKYLLEPDDFFNEYHIMPDKSDYPEALVTIDDLKDFMRKNEVSPMTGGKADLIKRIRDAGHKIDIWDDIVADAEKKLGAKEPLNRFQFKELMNAASMIKGEALDIVRGGVAELSIFWTDKATGVRLRSRLDYIKPGLIVDYKTFTNSLGMPLDKAVARAIQGQGYHLQALMYLAAYDAAKSLPIPEQLKEIFSKQPGFAFLFQTSDSPYEVRIKDFRRLDAAKSTENVYYIKAKQRLRDAVSKYAKYMNHYGPNKPWESLEPIRTDIEDSEMPWIMND